MTPKETHFVNYDQPGQRLARALCGKLVDPRTEHSPEPSCATCQQQRAAYEAMEV